MPKLAFILLRILNVRNTDCKLNLLYKLLGFKLVPLSLVDQSTFPDLLGVTSFSLTSIRAIGSYAMLFLVLCLPMSYPLHALPLKQYVLFCTPYLLILRLRISVTSLRIHLTFIRIILDAGNLYVNKSRLHESFFLNHYWS